MQKKETKGWKEPRVAITAIFVLAFALRFIFMWTHERHTDPKFLVESAGEAYEPGYIAHSIVTGKGFSSPKKGDTGPTAWLTPIYPYVIAADFELFGVYTRKALLAILTLNCFLGAATVAPIFLLGKRIHGPLLGIGCALVWAVYPGAILTGASISDGVFSGLCVATILWATLEIPTSRGIWIWAGYGLLWALTVMFNPAPFSVLPFFLIWLAWRLHKDRGPWLRLPATAALIFFLVGCVPWTVRNYSVFHEFVPFRSNFGYELWLGNNDRAPRPWTGSYKLDVMNDDAERALYAKVGEIEFVKMHRDEAVRFIRTHPGEEVNMTLLRAATFWVDFWFAPFEHDYTWISKPGLIGLILDSLLPFFALGGVVVLWQERNGSSLPIFILLLIFPLVYYITHPGFRYRRPLDPVLVVLAMIAFSRFFVRLAARLGMATATEGARNQ